MELENFLNKNSDWRAKLAVPPYCITVKEDGNFVMLRYDLVKSDFCNTLVLQARGSIFVQESGKWKCVCRALDGFRNWNEPAAKQLNWEKRVDVQEKIDGSLIKIWCYEGKWYVSTNGVIDAGKAMIGNSGISFLELFLKAAKIRIEDFPEIFNPRYTYWFELVAPQYNRIVIQYKEEKVYFLGARDMRDGEESAYVVPKGDWYARPKHFNLNTLERCVEKAHAMGSDEEGYVCVAREKYDGSFARIKVKGDEYLKMHKVRGNGCFSVKRVIELWQTNALDDMLAYFPSYKDFSLEVMGAIERVRRICEEVWERAPQQVERKEFAFFACKYLSFIRNFLFYRYDNKVEDAQEFLIKMNPRTLAEILMPQLKIKEIGVDEEI